MQALLEDGVAPIQARLFERLEVSRSTISDTVAALAAEGYLIAADTLALTPAGLELAERTIRRRRLAELFLAETLELSFSACRADAERWQHAISDDVEAGMTRVLDRPATCPHGNPIPYEVRADPAGRAGDVLPMSDLAPGTTFVVRRIREELEVVPGMLDYLDVTGLRPGAEGVVVGLSPDGTRTVSVAGQSAGLGPFVGTRLLVAPG